MLSIEALLAPIPGASPVGKDISYEPQFQDLATEIEKGALTGDVINWKHVLAESSKLLAEQSKDLRLASWVVAGGAKVEGWTGVVLGLEMLKQLAETFWEEMQPPVKRAKARAAVTEWLWGSLAESLAALPVSESDAEPVKKLEMALFEANNAIAQRLGNLAPAVGSLRALIRKRVADLPAPAPPPPPAPEPTVAAAAAPQASAAPAAPQRAAAPATAYVPEVAVPTAEPAPASLAEGVKQFNRLADPLLTVVYHSRRASPTAPWPYRVARLALWGTVDTDPTVREGSLTYIEAPREDVFERLPAIFQAGNWDVLRSTGEGLACENKYWLDPHRYVAVALERLGPSYAAAKAVVVREVASLLLRAPKLPFLQFEDGRPLATPETRDWLKEVAAQSSGSSDAGESGGVAAEVLAAAKEKVEAGEVDEALGKALSTARVASEGRDRFRIILGVAQMAHRSGKGGFALALYEQLFPEVTRELEVWDPRLCSEFLLSYLTVLRDGGQRNPSDERQPLLFRRLLGLDPAVAVRLSV